MGFKAEILRGEGGEALEQAALGSGAPALEVSGGGCVGVRLGEPRAEAVV